MPQPRKPVDEAVTERERNEYIPSFIAQKPFYLNEDEQKAADYLEHQRLNKDAISETWYERGKKLPAATKFRKGACENCGSMSHKTKECLSRPRKQGAKWTNKDIQADDVIQDVKLGWDAKRDRWNGYDPREHESLAKEWERMEEIRKQKLQAEKLAKTGDVDFDEVDGKIAEDVAMPGQTTATRTVRIREDTAKYLLNLDLESAKYDPKSRSMIDSGSVPDKAAALVAEDNFMRASGDAAEFEKAQRYAWEAQEKGGGPRTHLQANPTEGELIRKRQIKEEEEKRAEQRKKLLERYGGAEHLQPNLLPEARVTESEHFVEYSEDGLIKGAPKVIARSKYPEDVFLNNHVSVWGSWWYNFQWGYACCHSFVKKSYCTGDDGIKAFEEEQLRKKGMDLLGNVPEPEPEPESESVAKAVVKDKVEAPVKKMAEARIGEDTKKRTIEEMREGITEEELDAYKRTRTMADDPMAKFLGKDELLP